MTVLYLSKQLKQVLAGPARINKNEREVVAAIADELEVIHADQKRERLFCGHGLDHRKHGCGQKYPINEMFRCCFCLTYYCFNCSDKHFGKYEDHYSQELKNDNNKDS